MKNQIGVLALTAAIALMLATSVWAQQPGTNNHPTPDMKDMPGMQMKNGQMQKDQNMSNDQMMQSCHKNMQSMMDANAQTTKDIEAAKQSNDPAKMRTALDEAEKVLSPMNDHMKTCMSMMNMMQSMHGTGGMMPDQDNQKKEQKMPPQK